jgi:hypothetical protein
VTDSLARPVKTWTCPLCGRTISPKQGSCRSFATVISHHRQKHRPWTSVGKMWPLLPAETFA